LTNGLSLMSNSEIHFEIVTPERVVLKDTVTQITVPTLQGEITVLPHHIPLVATLQPGVVETLHPDGSRSIMSVSGGFIEVLANKVVILADTAERADEIDIDRAEEARRRAEASVKEMRQFDRCSFTDLSAQMAKELARTKAAKRWRRLKGE
jgi:F-type H+-transporting ATPase subunit epsilon